MRNLRLFWLLIHPCFTVFFVACACLAGCGENENRPTAPTAPVPPPGAFTRDVLDLNQQKTLDSCDQQWAEKKLKIARALDEKSAALHAYLAKLPNYEDGTRKKLGNTVLRIPHKMPDSSATSEAIPAWQEAWASWPDVEYELYQLRNEPVGEGWLRVNQEVSELIWYDRKRLVALENFYLRPTSHVLLTPLKGIFEGCLNAPNCIGIMLPEELEKFILDNPIYSGPWIQLRNATEIEERRDRIRWLWRRISHDLRRFEFRPYSKAKRISPQVIELPLDAGDFKGFEREIADHVEAIWSRPGQQVKIRWETSRPRKSLYRLISNLQVGQNTYVNKSFQRIEVGKDTSVASLAHAVGLVLGFTKQNYPIWQPWSCTYFTYTPVEDVLSGVEDGRVHPYAWHFLNYLYPLKVAPK